MAETNIDDTNVAINNKNLNLKPNRNILEENDVSVFATNSDSLKKKEFDSSEVQEKSDSDHFKSPNSFAVPVAVAFQNLTKKTNVSDEENAKDNLLKTKISNKTKSSFPKDNTLPIHIAVNYKEPEWGGEPKDNFAFDVLKNGRIIENIPLKDKSYFIFGRLPSCDFTLEHPSLSRYHAVVQYSSVETSTHGKGWYIYDLDSTHGTWVNKKRVNPKVFHKIKVGHIVKFGGSSRLHILQGPEEDREEESELSITEMKEQRDKQKREAELLRQIETQQKQEQAEKEQKLLQDKGCSWGIGEDAEEVDENPFACLTSENESLYIDDPKKALKGFYEREGIDLPDYQFTEASVGSNKCRLEIPVDGPNGEELIAEAVVSGKKKDAVIACALEACRMLDKLGMLRSSTHESKKRKERNWEDNDYYDSDEDTFLDRTGTIEKKRTMRMKKAGKDFVETYESLMEKHTKVTEKINDIEMKLLKAKEEAEALANEEKDELEAYMLSIKAGVMDTKTKMQLKGELLRLKMEEQNLRRLVNIAKPASLPPLQPAAPKSKSVKITATENLSRKLQHVQQQRQKQKKEVPLKQQIVMDTKPDEYEEEEDENEVESVSFSNPSEKSDIHKKLIETDDSSKYTCSVVKKNPPETSLNVSAKSKKSSQLFSTSSVLETIGVKQSSSKKVSKSSLQVDLDSMDPKFANWLPPSGQSGDGKTSLNEKYGY